MPILITAEDMIDEKKFGACYDANELRKLYDRPLTLLEVLTRNDTPEWKEVKLGDRLWVAEHKLSWTPEEKAALIEALKVRCSEFMADAKDKEKKAKKGNTGYSTYTYLERVERYEEVLNRKDVKGVDVCVLFSNDKTCQGRKYSGGSPPHNSTAELVDTCIAVLTPKETVPCQIPNKTDPTASSPVTENTTTQPETPELDVSQTTPSEKSEPSPSKEKKIAKPRKPAAKKPASGKVSKPASAREKKPS